MSPTLLLIAEVLVAVLLVATIATCINLHKRIVRLKSDESTMRQTIGELVIATENAERAIAGLRTTLSECDRTLAERLRTAERYAADLAGQVEAGETVLGRIARIVEVSQTIGQPVARAAAQPPAPVAPAPSPEPIPLFAAANPVEQKLSKAAAMAQSLMDRAVRRIEGQAA